MRKLRSKAHQSCRPRQASPPPQRKLNKLVLLFALARQSTTDPVRVAAVLLLGVACLLGCFKASTYFFSHVFEVRLWPYH
ncbi:hypothetical protein BRADI_2g41652v3 [Brachypodium distachyon]|uniref:Uncharacterized protein n=1 Tax=Brachypodium distachyon TaxID=15368 RepID=A0A2K2DD72_BRADI|nr:hypothetical protein BRADI_2g41652v3 [Brachypodium distachyon]